MEATLFRACVRAHAQSCGMCTVAHSCAGASDIARVPARPFMSLRCLSSGSPPLLAVALSGLCRQTSKCTQPPRKADKAFAGRQWVARVGSIRELWDGRECAAVSNMAWVLACPFNVSAQGPSPILPPSLAVGLPGNCRPTFKVSRRFAPVHKADTAAAGHNGGA